MIPVSRWLALLLLNTFLGASLVMAGSLHGAARRGDLAQIQSLITAGHNVNEKDELLSTPLHEAIIWGHYDVAKLLIEHGADVNVRTPLGDTPLYLAVNRERLSIAELLVKYGGEGISLERYKEWKADLKTERYNTPSDHQYVRPEVSGRLDSCSCLYVEGQAVPISCSNASCWP